MRTLTFSHCLLALLDRSRQVLEVAQQKSLGGLEESKDLKELVDMAP